MQFPHDQAQVSSLAGRQQLLLQVLDLLAQAAQLRSGPGARASRGSRLEGLEHPLEGALFVLIIGLAGDPQLAGRRTGREPTRADLQDQGRPLAGQEGGFHSCTPGLRGRVGNFLNLLQAGLEPVEVVGLLLLLEQAPEPRA